MHTSAHLPQHDSGLQQPTFTAPLLGSLIAHFFFFGIAYGLSLLAPTSPRLTIVETELVRLGVEKPVDRLPDKKTEVPMTEQQPDPQTDTRPTPPSSQAEEVSLKKTPPKKKKAPKQNVGDTLAKLRSKTRRRAAQEGHPDGVPEGTATGAKNLVLSLYTSRIVSCMNQNFKVQGAQSSSGDPKTNVIVHVKTRADGRLFGYHIVESSGIPRIDQAAQRAIKACENGPKPPSAELKRLKAGINFRFFPYRS